MKERTIEKGIILVIVPSMERQILLSILKKLEDQKVEAVQILDHFEDDEDGHHLIKAVVSYCKPKNIPVLINNRWEWIQDLNLDGVHFDKVPDDIDRIRAKLSEETLMGITCGNDTSVVQWAEENAMDYLSFCSMFPSVTSPNCELVRFDIVKEARKFTSMPIFLAGGIKPQNLDQLSLLDYSGIAVVSGIMDAQYPDEAINEYHQKLILHKR